MKVRTTILIDAEILKQAQELGVNVSKACENSLILLINAIKGVNAEIPGMGARLIIWRAKGAWAPFVQRSRAQIPPPAPVQQNSLNQNFRKLFLKLLLFEWIFQAGLQIPS